MALIRSGSVGTESPYLQYELYADQTGGSVNDRTIKITLKAKIGSGYYGYPANWRANINGTWSGWMRLKGTESWYKNDGFRTFEYSATTNVGTTSSRAITVGFGIDGYSGDDSWDSTVTGSFTVGATNRPPNPPSNIIVRNGGTASSPVLEAGIVPENITKLYISWNAASDPDGDQLTYALNESINNGGYVQRDFGTDLAHAYYTSGWDEGGTIQFYVDARDTKGVWSSKVYSGVLTKNRLTAGTIYEYSNNINFNTKSFEARFREGSNTDKSEVSYSCYSDSITIYNQTYTSDTKQKILIWRTGDATPASNQPYIKFNELVELYRSNNFTGTLSMGLFSKNIHGTKKSTVAAVVQVDLRVVPVAPSSVSITGGKAKKTIAGSTVYLPNGTDDITFSWGASTNPLNTPFSYDLYEVYNGEPIKITTVDSSITSYSYVRPPQLNDIASLAFKVVATTSYGYSSEKTSNQIRLEYYNPPTILIGEVARRDTSASVDALIKINTSIPSVKGTGDWECSNNQKGNITTSSSNINITNLKSDSTYSLIILYNDNSGLSTSRRESISIGKNLPIFLINEFGVGVNGVKADSNTTLKVNGKIHSSQGLLLEKNAGIGDSSNGFYLRNNGNATVLSASKNTIYLRPQGDTTPTNEVTISTNGVLNAPNLQVSGANVYTTKRKPTAADVGALPSSGGTLTGNTNIKANLSCNYLYINPLKFSSLDGNGVNSTSLARMVSSSEDIAGSLKVQLGGTDDKCSFEVIDKDWKRALFSVTNGGEVTFSHREAKSREFRTYKLSGTTGNYRNFIPTVANDGVMEVGKYIDFHDPTSTSDNEVRLTSGSGNLNCSGAFSQGSDRALKENIHYIDEDYAMFANVKDANKNQFKDFIKNDLKVATYNYKNVDDTVIGFIAQDVYDNDIAKFFVKEVETDEGAMLNFDLSGYTTIVAKALQEEIIEKDNKILELENRLKAIEEKLNIDI